MPVLKIPDGSGGYIPVRAPAGKEIELRKDVDNIQWRYVGDVSWVDLVSLEDIKGPKGDIGSTGEPGADGVGVPIGGNSGQVLKKVSATDFDTEWGDAADPNAIKSSDGSVTDIREVTQAEYDALTQTEKDEGTFFITDDLVGAINVVNGFASTSTTDPGSAKNDKDLKDLIDSAVAQLYKIGVACPGDNADNALSDGCYNYGPAMSNIPVAGGYGTIFTTVSVGLTGNNTDNWVNQMAMTTDNEIYFRQKVNASAWTAWSRIHYGDTGWVTPTLLNGWVNYGSGFTTAGYRKVGNKVMLKGLLKDGTMTLSMFVLPTGYRPTQTSIYAVNSGGVFGSIYIQTDGNVYAVVGSNAFISLDGIEFYID